ncbi:MAG: Asp-tRNA(Asn)/Glu-tRNA(Gln) amidotransferase subunit GatC [Candidatus Eremiobacteraeota bacterium]|nr:Asp-tRNA(Asn)/Glu-tRNA(Gln) amidotransferase subunit GatC [Candidatus Eremiobacteraeota bacterium]
MTKKVSEQQVAHVAHLARLQLTSDELDKYTEELGDILECIDKLRELDTTSIEASFQVVPLNNVFREDEVAQGLTVEEALRNAPSRKDNYFKMPPILDTEVKS